MRTLLATLFISCFLLQALALDESFRASLSPDFVHYLEHIGELEVITDSPNAEESKTTQPADGQNTGGLQPYLTDDFSSWLVANGYGGYNFERFDIAGGSYGGKASSSDQITKRPIIFFHGNSDRAMGNVTDAFSGWIDSLIYFTSQGYNKSELYATTWGPNNYTLSHDQYHSYAYLNYLRNFMEAVLNYTQADKVDVMGHSMGVTLARKVIKGGTGFDGSNSYDLGPPLTSRVGKFLSLAGANWGLVSCGIAVPSYPACGQYGFYPGSNATSGPGAYLAALNSDPTKEGDYVISLFSTADDLIQYGDLVWDKYTSQVPTEDDYIIYYNLTHMQVKTTTSAEQYRIITQSHALNIKALPLYYLAAIFMACLIIN